MKKQTKTMDRFIKHMAEMVEKYGDAVLKEIETKDANAQKQ